VCNSSINEIRSDYNLEDTIKEEESYSLDSDEDDLTSDVSFEDIEFIFDS